MTMTTTPAGAISMSVIPVLGSSMAYRAAHATQSPVALFLHGNPTSSFIWRNIIPHVASVASCIAPDLIGFGKSGKPRIGYRFADHVRYLDAFLDGLGIHSAYVVAQDWVRPWPLSSPRDDRGSCGDWPAWSLSGRCRAGTISTSCRQLARHSKSSGPPASVRNWCSTAMPSSSGCCPVRSCASLTMPR
jgi:alpha/beta hydrolase fold